MTPQQQTPSRFAPTRRPFTATILGSPRIGPNRELKRAVEKYWAGDLERSELESVAATLRRDTWESLVATGLDSMSRCAVGWRSASRRWPKLSRCREG